MSENILQNCLNHFPSAIQSTGRSHPNVHTCMCPMHTHADSCRQVHRLPLLPPMAPHLCPLQTLWTQFKYTHATCCAFAVPHWGPSSHLLQYIPDIFFIELPKVQNSGDDTVSVGPASLVIIHTHAIHAFAAAQCTAVITVEIDLLHLLKFAITM